MTSFLLKTRIQSVWFDLTNENLIYGLLRKSECNEREKHEKQRAEETVFHVGRKRRQGEQEGRGGLGGGKGERQGQHFLLLIPLSVAALQPQCSSPAIGAAQNALLCVWGPFLPFTFPPTGPEGTMSSSRLLPLTV